MTSFDDLQARFVAAELTMLGRPAPTGRVLQPALPLPARDDQALWSLFDAIPLDTPLYAPSGTEFFTAYSTLIGALVAGTNPLDPIAAAKRRLAVWGTKPPTWSVGSAGMAKLLKAAPSLSFPFSSPAGPQSGFWGLWAGSAPALGPSVQFAAGDVSATLAFDHVLAFAPTPGDWYVSSALSLAYGTRTGAPWPPGSTVTWDSTFGPDGTMPRFLAALTVVSGLKVRVTSTAAFSTTDQALILLSAAAGLWPYYLDVTAAETSVRFDASGQIAIATDNRSSSIVLAATVLSAGEFLG
jgi:hypothetical protein